MISMERFYTNGVNIPLPAEFKSWEWGEYYSNNSDYIPKSYPTFPVQITPMYQWRYDYQDHYDITNELKRKYRYRDRYHVVWEPVRFDLDGTDHRVKDRNGIVHVIPFGYG